MTSDAEHHSSRNSIQDIWGKRTPYKGEWPVRVDERCIEEPEKWVQSACVMCRYLLTLPSNGCGMDIGVKDGKIVGVRGRSVDRVNKGRLGPKGMYSWESRNHRDRLTHPLIRKNGKLERASWDEAMSLIVDKARDVRSRLTNHGIGFYTSGQLFLEEYYTLAVVGKAGLNTLHMDGNTRLCTATAAASMRESFGSDGQPGSYTDIDHTDCLLIVGHNMASTQTVLWSRVLDRLAGPEPPKIIVIDPRLSNTAEHATVHLAPKIGTNMAVLNGIQHLLFHNGWVEQDFVKKHVVGLDDLRQKVLPYTPEMVESITGIPAAQLSSAAQIIGTTKTLLSTVLQGVYQSNQATASACQVNNINLLRGCIGKPGSGIYQMNGQPTAQNNREAGCDGEYPGFRNYQNQNHMLEMTKIWNIDLDHAPHWNLPTHIESMLSYIAAGTIEMFWISGTNPLVSLPNLAKVRELLTKPGLFVIAQDIFPTETTAIADVVLPAAQWAEKTGCFTNVDRTVHISHKAVEPPGEAKSDLEIFADFARRMDLRDREGKLLVHWSTPEEAFEAWKMMSKGRPCDYTGMSYEKLSVGSGIQWPCNEENPEGKERLFGDGVFFTDIDYCESYGHDLETGAPLSKDQYRSMDPAGRAILKASDYFPAPDEPDEEYPLRLATGRNVYHFHTRTKTGRSKQLQAALPEPQVQISIEDAKTLGIVDGQSVIVQSRRGEVEMPACVCSIKKGQVFLPFHYGYFDALDDRARAANELTQEQWDPISKQPLFKSGAVRVLKARDAESNVRIHATEHHTAAVRSVEENKVNAHDLVQQCDRRRYLESWLASTYEAIVILLNLYDKRLPPKINDLGILAGFKKLSMLTGQIEQTLKPYMHKFKVSTVAKPLSISISLSDALFSVRREGPVAYQTLMLLQGVEVYLSHLSGLLTVLQPASAAMWDGEFVSAVNYSITQVQRQLSWIKHELKVQSPQTLVVPA